MVTLEQVLDLIATKLIENISTYSATPKETLLENQHTIRNGVIAAARAENERLILWEKDTKANAADLISWDDDADPATTEISLTSLIEQFGNIDISLVNLSFSGDIQNGGTLHIDFNSQPPGGVDITNILTNGEGNPLNISQFISLNDQETVVNTSAANQHLDTTIYELLPDAPSRQKRIDEFFNEYSLLKGDIPAWFQTDDSDYNPPELYEEGHDISHIQENPNDPNNSIEESDSFITRLNIDANTQNENKTLQSLRDDLNEYLKDIDEIKIASTEDDRPIYENKSDGYMKIRNLNQGIVIRRQEGDGVGLEDNINIPDGTVGISGQEHLHSDSDGPSYLMNGFTITMWVKFLDKTSRGTLFNYGNPLRGLDPKGFTLETYVLNKDDDMPSGGQTWGEAVEFNADSQGVDSDLFSTSDSERFVRLVVYDHIQNNQGYKALYDSRVGIPELPKIDNKVPEFGQINEGGTYNDYDEGYDLNLLAHTRIPIDFDEWYFIVATYDPLVWDSQSTYNTNYSSFPDYWRGNIDPYNSDPGGTITYSHKSGYGNKCKVEFISRSDLLRARGYKS